jgi:hypothetical protein
LESAAIQRLHSGINDLIHITTHFVIRSYFSSVSHTAGPQLPQSPPFSVLLQRPSSLPLTFLWRLEELRYGGIRQPLLWKEIPSV